MFEVFQVNENQIKFNDLHIESISNFEEYLPEMLANNFSGYYIIKTKLENGSLLEHKFLYVDKFYSDLYLYPLEIPKENMFNNEEKITLTKYQYIKFSIKDYKTKKNEIVDYEGYIRKRNTGEKKVTVKKINFLVEPPEGYNLDNFCSKGQIIVPLNNYSKKYQDLMKNNYYVGIYEIILILKTGEHINLFYNLSDLKENYLYLKARGWNFEHIRNLFNIPPKQILYTHFKYYSPSKRIHFASEFSKHSYEDNFEDKLICVNTRNFSNEVLSAIKLFKNKGTLIYSFKTKNDELNEIKEEYEFVKIKRIYQEKEYFVILKTKELPINSWYQTELSDIISEKWEYIIG